jgi:hypothetical protein
MRSAEEKQAATKINLPCKTRYRVPAKLSEGARFSRKNLNSDDHFDRSFSFMAMKDKLRNQSPFQKTKKEPL